MRFYDRLFLFLFSISFIIVSIFALLIGIGFFKYNLLQDVTTMLSTDPDLKMTIIIVSIAIILLGIYFLIKSMQTKEVMSFSNKHSEIGEIRISTETLENLASKVAARVKGVKEQKVRVRLEDNETVNIIIKIYVDGETPIPTISEEIQLSVKQTIEEIAGISVGNVHIIVANISHPNIKKSRVE